MAVSNKIGSGEAWLVMGTNYTKGQLFGLGGVTARRIICQDAGDLYLIPPGGSAGAGVVFATTVQAGQQFDQQCDGIGTSTTCTLVTIQK